MLFSDWSQEEWIKFDNFMIQCVQYYLENGLVSHNFNNLEIRKFIKETSFEFYEWSQDRENLPYNVRLDKNEYYLRFMGEYQDFKKWLSQKRFTQWLDAYAKFYGVKATHGRTHSMRYVEFTTDDYVPNDNDDDNELPF